MSDILKNMSAPPRSSVNFSMLQCKKYIAFNPFLLSKLLTKKYEQNNLSIVVKKYVDANPGVTNSIKKPTGYMLGEYIELRGIKSKEKLLNKLKLYNYDECEDLELMILVFCSTVGDLYIPNRNLSFEENKFDKVLLFPEEEVNS